MAVPFAKAVPLACAENFPVAAFKNPSDNSQKGSAVCKASLGPLRPFRKEMIFDHLHESSMAFLFSQSKRIGLRQDVIY